MDESEEFKQAIDLLKTLTLKQERMLDRLKAVSVGQQILAFRLGADHVLDESATTELESAAFLLDQNGSSRAAQYLRNLKELASGGRGVILGVHAESEFQDERLLRQIVEHQDNVLSFRADQGRTRSEDDPAND